MNTKEREVSDYLAGQKSDMLRLLETLVLIDNPSRGREGIDAMGAAIGDFLKSRGIDSSTIPSDAYGSGLRATARGGSGKPIVLLGHMDTVFPVGEARRRPFQIVGDRAHESSGRDMTSSTGLDHAGSRLRQNPRPILITAAIDQASS